MTGAEIQELLPGQVRDADHCDTLCAGLKIGEGGEWTWGDGHEGEATVELGEPLFIVCVEPVSSRPTADGEELIMVLAISHESVGWFNFTLPQKEKAE